MNSDPSYKRYPAPGPSRNAVWMIIILVTIMLVLHVATRFVP